jgi:alpha-N-arabinofuranosidase
LRDAIKACRVAAKGDRRGLGVAAAGRCYLKVEAHEQAYSFYVAEVSDQWKPVAEGIDGRILSTPVAGGFVGAVIALYASSNGQPSTNCADFDWFEYVGFDEA